MKRFIVTVSLVFIVSCLFSQQTEISLDTITFENTCTYLKIDTSSQNIWQIGVPNKTIFNSSYSLTHAIVTDTVNYYPVNNHSYFDIYIGRTIPVGNYYNSPFPWAFGFEINHKYDTDTLHDGGYITISYDMGNTWTNIINDTLFSVMVGGNVTPSSIYFPSSNLYDTSNTLFNNEYGFSGRSNGWINTKFHWYTNMNKINSKNNLDTFIIRFNFISDSINHNKEGWMIDNIRYFTMVVYGEIQSLSANNNISISPNPFKHQTEIKFDKNYDLIDMKIYNLQGILVDELKTNNQDKVIYSNNHLAAGMYFCKINIDNKISETKKLIIAE